MTIWTILWIGWIVAFFVIEGIALYRDRTKLGATLSEHLRLWFRIDTKLGRTAFLVVFGGFVAWFGVHLLTGTV